MSDFIIDQRFFKILKLLNLKGYNLIVEMLMERFAKHQKENKKTIKPL